MAQVKKISVATTFGKIAIKELINAGKPMPVMDVYGTAVGIKEGVSAYGDWKCLTGQFRAISSRANKDGVLIVNDASQCFLPEVAMIPLEVALAQGAKGVEFAIRVLVEFDDAAQAKYVYSFEPLLAPSQDDPLVRLEAKLKGEGVLLLGQAVAPTAEQVVETPAAKSAKK